MTEVASATSLARTYRYVRLAILGAVLAILVSVAAVAIGAGTAPESLSAGFYTPARTVFTGSLFAVSLALLALSGRSVPQALLDVAAVLAPLVAIIPTPVEGVVPAAVHADVVNGLVTFLLVGVAGLVAAVVVARAQGTLTRGVVTTLAVVAVLVVGFPLWAVLDEGSLLRFGHLTATLAFFAVIAAVAGWTAWAPSSSRPSVRGVYGVIAIGIILAIVFLLAVFLLQLADPGAPPRDIPLVLIGEVVLLMLFAAFWVVETVRTWSDPDPRIR
ncbi:hypothetical protein QSU92_02340 [Microbacterium sp. ET2]|uniref:hypothetical protein n=1 Tax=Microbacterium albipurpureum TaxID=3050384 RepID=UPI00259C79C0|nr:hypothetical protein [Microbacterium sp. ET2 (Ac-2212)]WJL96070.1 hypothetical protein QSU92_02340 [Microbacterium sp. ET2 (Ac-2212)]